MIIRIKVLIDYEWKRMQSEKKGDKILGNTFKGKRLKEGPEIE